MSDRIDAATLQDDAARIMHSHGVDEAQVRTQTALEANAAVEAGASRRLSTPAARSEVTASAAWGAAR